MMDSAGIISVYSPPASQMAGYWSPVMDINSLEKEKKMLFDEFHRLVYEIHQKTGIRNLILEKKYQTIQESLETKDAQIN